MTIPRSQATPEDPSKLPPARRRRARRALGPLDADAREAFWNKTAHRAEPSVDFFFHLALAALVWSVGLSLDQPALLLLGALLAPPMTPLLGLGLGIVTGAARYFVHVLGGIVLGSLLAFGLGALGGAAGLLWMPSQLQQPPLHASLSVWDFAVLAVAAIWATVALVRRPAAALLPAAALAYEVFLPLVTAGFGWGSSLPHLFPEGLVVFAVHLAWAALFSAITFAVLGFRPLTLFGYTLGGVALLVGGVVLVLALGLGTALGWSPAIDIGFSPATAVQFAPPPTPTVFSPASAVTVSPSPTPTPAPSPTATRTPAPSMTPTPTPSPSSTPSPSPTPAYAIVAAPEKYGGILIREDAGFEHKVVGRANNGEKIQVLGPEKEADNYIWVQVLIPSSGKTGWVLVHLLDMATPSPKW